MKIIKYFSISNFLHRVLAVQKREISDVSLNRAKWRPGDSRAERSCFDVTVQLSPGLHFARFVTQPEVKFHVFRRLKCGEENSISKKFL